MALIDQLKQIVEDLQADKPNTTIYIFVFSFIVTMMVALFRECRADPVKKELKEAVLAYDQPSKLYKFLTNMKVETTANYHYFNMSANLLKQSGPPTKVCVNQLLKVCSIDNTPVNWNRCFKLINRIRFYHKVKQ